LNKLRYDLRKLKGHGLLERDGSRYAYRLTSKGVQVALLFLFFHKRLCGPLANSRFHHRPDPQHRPNSRLEAAYHRADKASITRSYKPIEYGFSIVASETNRCPQIRALTTLWDCFPIQDERKNAQCL
jgi:hypothetical protein